MTTSPTGPSDSPELKPVSKLTLDSFDAMSTLLTSFEAAFQWPPIQPFIDDELYCPRCAQLRRMHVAPLYSLIVQTDREHRSHRYTTPDKLLPFLVGLACVQCDAFFLALGYLGPDGPELAIHSNVRGGLRTPLTPDGVAYYLDQAHRAQSMSANSAAVAMYRGALEHLLFEQGFTNGMLGTKLAELEARIAANTAPKWTADIDIDFLKLLKDLGNGAIHPNDGDVSGQALLDKKVLQAIEAVFAALLFLVYEAPTRKQNLLAELKNASSAFKK